MIAGESWLLVNDVFILLRCKLILEIMYLKKNLFLCSRSKTDSPPDKVQQLTARRMSTPKHCSSLLRAHLQVQVLFFSFLKKKLFGDIMVSSFL